MFTHRFQWNFYGMSLQVFRNKQANIANTQLQNAQNES